MMSDAWTEERHGDLLIFGPGRTPPGILLTVSARAAAPDGSPSPTAFLARRLAEALGLTGIPIVRATQVHGTAAVAVGERPPAGAVLDAGACDILLTTLPGMALVVQTADCVPVVLAG